MDDHDDDDDCLMPKHTHALYYPYYNIECFVCYFFFLFSVIVFLYVDVCPYMCACVFVWTIIITQKWYKYASDDLDKHFPKYIINVCCQWCDMSH